MGCVFSFTRVKVTAKTLPTIARFTELVKDRIIAAGIRSNICGDCSWDYICRKKEQES